MDNFLGILGLVFILGIKHAIESDHIIAVSTITGRYKSFRKCYDDTLGSINTIFTKLDSKKDFLIKIRNSR